MLRDEEYMVQTPVPPATHGQWEAESYQYRRVIRDSDLKGSRVRNSAGEQLGTIEDIMLDVPTGRIAYAVLSFGGFLHMGNKLFALPWNALTLNAREHEFILNVDKQKLKDAPGFDKNNWPDMADPSWAAQIHSHWSQDKQWMDSAQHKTDEIDRRQREGTFDRDRNPNL